MVDVLSGTEPFSFEGNDVGVLVLHGFTGSTQSVRDLGEGLHKRYGFTVGGPRLPGHGTSPDDMETTGYLDWVGEAEKALHALAARKRQVFVTGLSMGGSLPLNLAPLRIPGIGSDIKARDVVELAYPEVPVACLREVTLLVALTRDLLHNLKCPTLVIQAREDHVVPAVNAMQIVQMIRADDIRLLWLNQSYHVASLDNDKALIIERVGEFF